MCVCVSLPLSLSIYIYIHNLFLRGVSIMMQTRGLEGLVDFEQLSNDCPVFEILERTKGVPRNGGRK